jgi:hypothetical protein
VQKVDELIDTHERKRCCTPTLMLGKFHYLFVFTWIKNLLIFFHVPILQSQFSVKEKKSSEKLRDNLNVRRNERFSFLQPTHSTFHSAIRKQKNHLTWSRFSSLVYVVEWQVEWCKRYLVEKIELYTPSFTKILLMRL